MFALVHIISISDKLPRKGLKIAHINICSLRNKVHEINNLLTSDNINALAISETQIIYLMIVAIQGYNIYRRDSNAHGGGVAVYIQSHIPVMPREDLMSSVIEVLWLQVPLAHLKPFLLGCCYRPPSANSQHLNDMCEMLDSVCDVNREVYFLRDLNIDCFLSSCLLKRKLLTLTNACNLVQVIHQFTRVFTNTTGTRSFKCIDNTSTNTVDFVLKLCPYPLDAVITI